MQSWMWVVLGGGIGSLLRYRVSVWAMQYAATWRFPLATLIVNLAGCFVIGVLAAASERRDGFSNDLRVFLMTGLLGGFTTFSAFGLETVLLIRRGELLVAAGNSFANLGGGLLAVALGFGLISMLQR